MVWTYLRACYRFNMRLWIGGQEVTYPARWYFCDPGAKRFPGPHGAEASPWLKDHETNLDWGDDGTLRALDRGINPGYPGVCSVGEPQWFIDGQLPADFLKAPQPVTPACCGYTPPFNPDPRCPSFCEAIPSPFGDTGTVYQVYRATVVGATGDFAITNGVSIAKLVRQFPLQWEWDFDRFTDGGINADHSQFLVTFGDLPPIFSGNFVQFGMPAPYDPTTVPLVMHPVASHGNGDPGTVILTC